MIYLFTGNPGEGKTLNALDFVINIQKDSRDSGVDRDVFVFNFQRFKDGEIFDKDHPNFSDVQEWKELEKDDLTDNIWSLYDDQHPKIKHGSIILVDECQDIYPTRSKGSVPDFLKFFEKHRHTGCDFILVTQKIRQVDIHLRSLVGEHRDFKRIMGRDVVRIKTLPRVMEGKDEESLEIVTSQKKYPKHLFGLYKSAQIHTHKKKLPKVVYLIPVFIGFISFLLWFTFDTLMADRGDKNNNKISQKVTNYNEKVENLDTINIKELVNTFHPSKISNVYRIIYFDLDDDVLITDENSVYTISKKKHCSFHKTFKFVCVFDNKFLVQRGKKDDKEDKNPANPF